MFSGVKVFSATKAKDRELLSDNVTRWLTEHPEFEVVDRAVRQSSDNEFHCYSLTIFYRERPQVVRPRPVPAKAAGSSAVGS